MVALAAALPAAAASVEASAVLAVAAASAAAVAAESGKELTLCLQQRRLSDGQNQYAVVVVRIVRHSLSLNSLFYISFMDDNSLPIL